LKITPTILDEDPVVDIKSLLQVKVCTCRHHLRNNDIYQTLRVIYRWKYVHVNTIWGI